MDGTKRTGALQQVSLKRRFQGADRVVLASVEGMSAAFGRNAHGDDLIISTVTLKVHQSLRGNASTTTSFELEGGTVGDLTLEVSDMPSLKLGDRGVFALRRDNTGSWVPNHRALGILLLPQGADLDRVRSAERVSR